MLTSVTVGMQDVLKMVCHVGHFHFDVDATHVVSVFSNGDALCNKPGPERSRQLGGIRYSEELRVAQSVP